MSRKTALLVLDMQEGIASSVPRIKNIIKANQRAIEANKTTSNTSHFHTFSVR